ncbi:hypothetical protein [Kordiimonas pumila]|uniref:Hydrolase n=1 Tax=Kordiimonas pumila TaxID=2161677 RepID=A0ABV7DAR2_9PROT|nr:hypothetical protein [Kordiimonas pumila]
MSKTDKIAESVIVDVEGAIIHRAQKLPLILKMAKDFWRIKKYWDHITTK